MKEETVAEKSSRSEKRYSNCNTTLNDEQPSPPCNSVRAIEITQYARSYETAKGIRQ
jgi:hypothetical protein